MNKGVFGSEEVLPSPRLDDMTFQQLVDKTRVLIPRYCPEWTDHNLSDPGITLLELFAHLVDGMMFRMNQVPERMYVRFLEMVGIHLEPPVPASAEITFYLAKDAEREIIIGADTEVATRRTELESSIAFTLTEPLVIRPPTPTVILTASVASGSTDNRSRGVLRWRRENPTPLNTTPINMFPDDRPPMPGDAFWIGFAESLSRHVLEFELTCDPERAGGLDTDDPPVTWSVVGDSYDLPANCEVLLDTTAGFVRDGKVRIQIPEMGRQRLGGIDAYWLQCRIIQKSNSQYRTTPQITIKKIGTTGGTMTATHATTITDEFLGRSDGSPGQEFQLRYHPVIEARRPDEFLVVDIANGPTESWKEVSDFAASQPQDPHFILDSTTGRLAFGPAIVQPDGRVCQLGRIPPRGATLRFSRYRHGGGIAGNVLSGKICVLKTALPSITRVENRHDARFGRNGESIEHAKLRAAQQLRSRERAVTTDDYVFLAEKMPGIARACCIGVGPAGDTTNFDSRPGMVRVRILPTMAATMLESDLIKHTQSTAFSDLGRNTATNLLKQSPVGVQVDVDSPAFVQLKIEVRLFTFNLGTVRDLSAEEIKRNAEQTLRRYLSPYFGGSDERGWPFGRSVTVAELRTVLEKVKGVEFSDLEIEPVNPQDPAMRSREAKSRIDLFGWALPFLTSLKIAFGR